MDDYVDGLSDRVLVMENKMSERKILLAHRRDETLERHLENGHLKENCNSAHAATSACEWRNGLFYH
jgi:hypothetical protein